MRPVRRSIGLVLCVLTALPAWAQGPAGKPAAAETPLSRCVAGNREKLADWAEAVEAAHNRHRINPVLVSRLRTLEADMGTLRNRLPKDSRNLKDCEALSQAISAEQDRLPRVAGTEPQVAECLAANAQSLREALQGFEALLKAAAGQPAQTTPAEAALARLTDLRGPVGRESQTIAACRQFTTAIAQERAQLAAIAALDTSADAAAMDNCRSTNIDGYGELSRAWRESAASRGLKAGNADFDAAMAQAAQVARRRGAAGLCLGRMRDLVASHCARTGPCTGRAGGQPSRRLRRTRQASASATPTALVFHGG
jgi:hypothetical protein